MSAALSLHRTSSLTALTYLTRCTSCAHVSLQVCMIAQKKKIFFLYFLCTHYIKLTFLLFIASSRAAWTSLHWRLSWQRIQNAAVAVKRQWQGMCLLCICCCCFTFFVFFWVYFTGRQLSSAYRHSSQVELICGDLIWYRAHSTIYIYICVYKCMCVCFCLRVPMSRGVKYIFYENLSYAFVFISDVALIKLLLLLLLLPLLLCRCSW